MAKFSSRLDFFFSFNANKSIMSKNKDKIKQLHSIISEAKSLENENLPSIATEAEIATDPEIHSIIATTPNKTHLTPTVLIQLRTAFSLGWDVKDACSFAGINTSTFYDYLNANPLFARYIQTWQLSPRQKAANVMFDLLNSKDEKIRITAAKFILEHLDPSYIKKSVNQSPSDSQTAKNTAHVSKKEIMETANLIAINIYQPKKDNPPINI